MNPTGFLPAGLATEDVILVVATLAAIVSALAVWQALIERDDVTPRLKALAARRAALKAEAMAAPRARRPTSGVMHGIVGRLNLLRSREAEKARIALARAGLRSRDAVVTYLFARVVSPFVFGGLALVATWLRIIPVGDAYTTLVAVAGVLVGAVAPGIYVKNLTEKRRQAMQKGLPDALDLMVICTEAGLSLDAALTRVSRELGGSCPPLADELGLAAVELSFLPERRQALENLNQRTDMGSIRGVVNTLQQSEKYGTPLAHSLRVLAAEFRNERLMRAEEKAARLPAIMTVPMIVFILPTLFVVLLGPAVLRIMKTFSGH